MQRRVLVCLIFIALGCIITLNPFSTYASPSHLDAYFGGESAPGSWRWSGSWSWTEEPFRYRIIFHAAVDGLANVLTLFLPRDLTTYWIAFVICFIASIAFAAVSLDALLDTFGFKPTLSSVLLVSWCAMPPIHAASVLPVQTKEDFLTYGILFLGLRAILNGNYRAVLFLSIVGAFTRETLLILPGVFVLLGTGHIARRCLPLCGALAIHAALRLGLGADGYDVVRDENFSSALLVLVSVFLVLGYAWVPFLNWLSPMSFLRATALAIRNGFTKELLYTSNPLERFMSVAPVMLAMLLIAHLFMGRIVEIRISALIVPWVLLALGWFLQSTSSAFSLVRAMGIIATLGAAVVAFEASGAAGHLRLAVNPLIGPFSSQFWWAQFYGQIALTVVCLDLWFRSRRVAKYSRNV